MLYVGTVQLHLCPPPFTEYEYMEDLLQLHSMQRPIPGEVPRVLMGNPTPLREEEW